jgi:hypothetical protein
MKRRLPGILLCLAAIVASGCATNDVPEEPIEWSADWFRCDSRFECIAVLDAYCKYTAVNSGYSLVYQDWARQQVERVGERIPCEASGSDEKHLAAVCRSNRCEHPGSYK